jgi:aflatoxin B1 aldehyde reductase
MLQESLNVYVCIAVILTLTAASNSNFYGQFGLSNFMPQDVQKIYDIQAAAKSILPTVFQGNYNAVSRHVEDDLFPVLRKLGISFYAYSPIAGSFFLQDPIRLQADNGQGRFAAKAGPGLMYKRLYCKESLINALFVWADIAREAGVTKAALAYRWIAHHSALKKEYGDGFTIGCSKVSQLDETCTAIEAGPLHPDIAKRVDDIWGTVKHEAPRDNWHDYLAHNSLF